MSSIDRRLFLTQMAAVPLFLRAAAAQKLNFIFILIDDMGWTDLGCFSSRFYETPNIDRLAAEGLKFTDAYAACPVCSPTRASIMTGRYPARLHLTDWIPGRKQWPAARLLTPQFNQQLPLDEVTIAEALQPAAYASASIGKWHLGGEGFSPETQGFDFNIGGTFRGSPASYWGPFDLPGLKGGTSDDYLTDRLSTEALKFVEKNNDRPFVAYLPHFAVHIPLQARQKLIEHYRAKAKPDDPQHDATYAAMVQSVDEAVGKLMRKLDELGIAERTVIFFTSDNGGLIYEGSRKEPVTSNLPLRAGKGHLYEGGIRVPLIVRWPGVVKPGSVCHVPVSSVDYFPTMLELAGARPDAAHPVDGRSLVPLVKQTSSRKLEARPLFWHYPHYSNQGGVPSAAVRLGDYKLIEFYEDGRLELFNLADDIGERKNLVKKQPKKAAELHELLKKWRASVDAAMPQLNPNYDPAKAAQGLAGAQPKTEPI
ncbi:MAG: sulfatase [Acidobacteria bacterium]|jgi:arylsulfatase A-like enzyme|nr:sulfatase [Acidobacteriota bacterium]